ncbi:TetR/AcrR family transcriptional regulator [Kitasatospora sp. NPDC059327]|uniref:TetR/AcrR family transcriptional regulator n=1 Tax=Kitasatospora sp. NPDC059327 TaxID=3346803 RepID=UPI00367D9E05
MIDTAKGPARPTTPAQRARFDRIVEVATLVVTRSGEEGLQMAQLPKLADVSLSTLYRYFTSKQHLLFAVVEHHLQAALARTRPGGGSEASVRERAAEHLLRVYGLDQRVPTLGALMRRLSAVTDPGFVTERAVVDELHRKILHRALGPLSDHQGRVLNLVVLGADAAIRLGLTGVLSPAEVRFQILTVSRLLDLTPAQVEQDERSADR